MLRPCPTDGLARAVWFRELAAIVEDTDHIGAALYRQTAASIERRVMSEKPLHVLMEGGHVSSSPQR